MFIVQGASQSHKKESYNELQVDVSEYVVIYFD